MVAPKKEAVKYSRNLQQSTTGSDSYIFQLKSAPRENMSIADFRKFALLKGHLNCHSERAQPLALPALRRFSEGGSNAEGEVKNLFPAKTRDSSLACGELRMTFNFLQSGILRFMSAFKTAIISFSAVCETTLRLAASELLLSALIDFGVRA